MQQQNLSRGYLILAGRNMGKGSSLDLKKVISHLSGGDASLRGMFAVVSILQSQLHSVNGRRACGSLTILPLSSTSEDLGINTVLLSAKCAGIVPPSSTPVVPAPVDTRTSRQLGEAQKIILKSDSAKTNSSSNKMNLSQSRHHRYNQSAQTNFGETCCVPC